MKKVTKRDLVRQTKKQSDESAQLRRHLLDLNNLIKQKNAALFMTGVALRIVDPDNKLFKDFFKEPTVKAMDDHIALLKKEKEDESSKPSTGSAVLLGQTGGGPGPTGSDTTEHANAGVAGTDACPEPANPNVQS